MNQKMTLLILFVEGKDIYNLLLHQQIFEFLFYRHALCRAKQVVL